MAEAVKVAVRVRPFNGRERDRGAKSVNTLRLGSAIHRYLPRTLMRNPTPSNVLLRRPGFFYADMRSTLMTSLHPKADYSDEREHYHNQKPRRARR